MTYLYVMNCYSTTEPCYTLEQAYFLGNQRFRHSKYRELKIYKRKGNKNILIHDYNEHGITPGCILMEKLWETECSTSESYYKAIAAA